MNVFNRVSLSEMRAYQTPYVPVLDALQVATDVNTGRPSYTFSETTNTGLLALPYFDAWATVATPIAITPSDSFWIPETSLAVVHGSNGAVITTSDGITWTTRLAPSGYNFSAGANAPDLPLAVLLSTSTFSPVVSVDGGLSWETTAGTSLTSVADLVWAPELTLFLAPFGTAPNFGAYKSSDGLTWTTTIESQSVHGLTNAAWSPELGLFALVSSITSTAFTSANGSAWTTSFIGACTPNWNDVVWSAPLALFVAVGDVGCVATSADGIIWDAQRHHAFDGDSIMTVNTSVNGALYATTGTDIFQSHNARLWTRANAPTLAFNSVLATSDFAIASTGSDVLAVQLASASLIAFSDDSAVLTLNPAASDFASEEIWIGSNTVNLHLDTRIEAAGSIASRESENVDSLAYTYTANPLVGATLFGNNRSWTRVSPELTSPYYSGIYAAEQSLYVAVGDFITTSPDAENWTTLVYARSIVGQIQAQVTYSPELTLFASASLGSGPTCKGYYSADGVTWNQSTTATPASVGIEWIPERTVFFNTFSTGYRMSTDGDTYTAHTLPLATVIQKQQWTPELTQMLIIRASISASVMRSSDLLSWTTHRLTTSPTELAWAPELTLYLTSSSANSLYGSSPDGITWTTLTGGFPMASLYYDAPTRRFLGTNSTAPYLYSTHDGITWASLSLPIGGVSYQSLSRNNGILEAFGVGIYNADANANALVDTGMITLESSAANTTLRATTSESFIVGPTTICTMDSAGAQVTALRFSSGASLSAYDYTTTWTPFSGSPSYTNITGTPTTSNAWVQRIGPICYASVFVSGLSVTAAAPTFSRVLALTLPIASLSNTSAIYGSWTITGTTITAVDVGSAVDNTAGNATQFALVATSTNVSGTVNFSITLRYAVA